MLTGDEAYRCRSAAISLGFRRLLRRKEMKEGRKEASERARARERETERKPGHHHARSGLHFLSKLSAGVLGTALLNNLVFFFFFLLSISLSQFIAYISLSFLIIPHCYLVNTRSSVSHSTLTNHQSPILQESNHILPWPGSSAFLQKSER